MKAKFFLWAVFGLALHIALSQNLEIKQNNCLPDSLIFTIKDVGAYQNPVLIYQVNLAGDTSMDNWYKLEDFDPLVKDKHLLVRTMLYENNCIVTAVGFKKTLARNWQKQDGDYMFRVAMPRHNQEKFTVNFLLAEDGEENKILFQPIQREISRAYIKNYKRKCVE